MMNSFLEVVFTKCFLFIQLLISTYKKDSQLFSQLQVFIHKITLSQAWADESMVKELAKFSEDYSTFPRIFKEPNYSPFEAKWQGIPETNWLVRLPMSTISVLDRENLPQKVKWIVIKEASKHQPLASIHMNMHIYLQIHVFPHVYIQAQTPYTYIERLKWKKNIVMRSMTWLCVSRNYYCILFSLL